MILATRGSALAMAQAAIVKKKLEDVGEQVTILPVKTKGDRDRQRPLTEIGGDGLFIRELEKVLLSGEADLAVHSAKDLPYQLADGLRIAGVPEAADPRDCLLTRSCTADPGADYGPDPLCIGTGSPRRRLEYARRYPDAMYLEIRGNVLTRVEKLRRGEYDGIILAKAGLDRLN